MLNQPLRYAVMGVATVGLLVWIRFHKEPDSKTYNSILIAPPYSVPMLMPSSSVRRTATRLM